MKETRGKTPAIAGGVIVNIGQMTLNPMSLHNSSVLAHNRQDRTQAHRNLQIRVDRHIQSYT